VTELGGGKGSCSGSLRGSTLGWNERAILTQDHPVRALQLVTGFEASSSVSVRRFW
jgi:hypothetical protein